MKTTVAEFVRIQNQLNSHEFSYESRLTVSLGRTSKGAEYAFG